MTKLPIVALIVSLAYGCTKYTPPDEMLVRNCTFEHNGICVSVSEGISVPEEIVAYAIEAVVYGFEQSNPLEEFGFEPNDTVSILNAAGTIVQFLPFEVVGNMFRGATASGGRDFNDLITVRHSTMCRELVYVLGHEMLHVTANYLTPGTGHGLPWLFLEWAYKEEKSTNTIIPWEKTTEYGVFIKAGLLCKEYDQTSFVSDG